MKPSHRIEHVFEAIRAGHYPKPKPKRDAYGILPQPIHHSGPRKATGQKLAHSTFPANSKIGGTTH